VNYTIAHRLVGYDPDTERVAFQKEIPDNLLRTVLSLVETDKDDSDVFDSYPVTRSAARDILGMIHAEARDLDYFLEGYQRSF